MSSLSRSQIEKDLITFNFIVITMAKNQWCCP